MSWIIKLAAVISSSLAYFKIILFWYKTGAVFWRMTLNGVYIQAVQLLRITILQVCQQISRAIATRIWINYEIMHNNSNGIDTAELNESIHNNWKEKSATFRIDRLEPVNGKIAAKTQNCVAQKAGVLQRLLHSNPYEELLIKPHWHSFICLARRKR